VPLDLFERAIFLSRTVVGRALAPPALRAVAEVVREVTFESDAVIAYEADQGSDILLVVEGQVAVRTLGSPPPKGAKGDALGREIGRFGPDAVLGEIAVLSDEPRSASMIAVDRVVLLALHREDLHDAIAACPDLAFGLFRVLIERIRRADARRLSIPPPAGRDDA
jgi:CRP/FNR family transcriptional regulator, cyclic AMP receptor protein